MLAPDAVIDNSIRIIYNLIRNKKYRKAKGVINYTLKEFQTNYNFNFNCDQQFLQHVVDILSNSLDDMNSYKYTIVHNNMRDLHYEIYNKYI
jgi:hypothetical protein